MRHLWHPKPPRKCLKPLTSGWCISRRPRPIWWQKWGRISEWVNIDHVILKDHCGQPVLPESIGNLEDAINAMDPSSNFNDTWQDLLINARYGPIWPGMAWYGLVVRDHVASFFFFTPSGWSLKSTWPHLGCPQHSGPLR